MEQKQCYGSTVDKTYAKVDGGIDNPGYLTGSAVFDTGENINIKMKMLSGNINATVDTENSLIYNIKYSETIEEEHKIPQNIVSTNDSQLPIYMWYKDGTIYWWSESNKVMLNQDSSNMFRNLRELTNLDLSRFYSGRVTNMSNMFKDCIALNKILIDNSWKTSRVTMSTDMFSNCTSLVGIYGTVYDGNYTDISYAKIDRGTEDPGYLSARARFMGGTNINIKMKQLFGSTSNSADSQNTTIKSFEYSEDVDEENKVDVAFENSLVPIYMWADTTNGKIYWYSKDANPYLFRTASYMFANLKGLQYVETSRLDTSRVTNMSYMFTNCMALTNVDTSNFNTSRVEYMQYMFQGCSVLEKIDLTSFNTSRVTNMSSMFYGCAKLLILDLGNFDTRKVTNMQAMFRECSILETIYVGRLWNTSGVTSSGDMFNGCYNIVGGAGTVYNKNNINATYAVIDGQEENPGYLTGVAMFDTGENVNIKIKTLAEGVQSTTDTVNSTIHEFKYSNTIGENLKIDAHKISAENSTLPIYAWYENGTMYWWCESNKVMLNPDSSSMFKNLRGLTNLDMSNYYAWRVTNMSEMFSGCTSLSEVWIDIGWNTNKVTQSTNMFYNCTSIRGIGGTTYDVNHVDVLYARQDNTPYTPGYFSANATFNTGEQINIAMKKLCNQSNATYSTANTAITSIQYASVVNTENVVDVSGYRSMLPIYMWKSGGTIYWHCANNRPYINENAKYMFANLKGLSSIDLNLFNTSKVEDMSYMFYYCTNLETLDLSGFETQNVTNMQYMFANCTNIETLDLSSFDTKNVTDMHYMFNHCDNLKDIDIRSFDTSIVTTMEYMFGSDSSLVTLDLSSFNTEKLTNTKNMFNGCANIETIYVSNMWDVSSISTSNSSNMFSGCTKIVGGAGTTYSSGNINRTYAIVDGTNGNPGYLTGNVKFNTGEAVNIKMKSLAVGGSPTVDTVDTAIHEIKYSNTIDESLKVDPHKVSAEDSYSPIYMWYEDGTIYWWSESTKTMFNRDSSSMFKNLNGLTKLDLSGYYSGNVENMSNMFNGCTNLAEIWVDYSWTTKSVTESTNMFSNCTSLEGIAGTAYDANHVDVLYARADDAPFTPGYFSANAIFDTGSNINIAMKKLSGASNPSTTSQNTSITAFEHSDTIDQNANIVTISAVNSALPIYMWKNGSTIYWYSANSNPYLNNDAASMFESMRGITVLDLSDINTSKTTTIAKMFNGCINLTTIYVGDLWSTESLSGVSANVFTSSSKLIGGNGNTYNKNNVSSDYARIDGENGTPGYLTRKP